MQLVARQPLELVILVRVQAPEPLLKSGVCGHIPAIPLPLSYARIANISKGWRKTAVSSPPFHSQCHRETARKAWPLRRFRFPALPTNPNFSFPACRCFNELEISEFHCPQTHESVEKVCWSRILFALTSPCCATEHCREEHRR